MAMLIRPIRPPIKPPGGGGPTPPPIGGGLPGLRFEDLPLEEQLALATSYQNELKSRPPERRGEGAKSAAGGDCTRYFKQKDARSGKTIWKVLTGQPCGPDARPTPRPPPPPPPARPPAPTPRRVCDYGTPIRQHIDGLLQSGAGPYGGLGGWKSEGINIIRLELPICADIAREFNDKILELKQRVITDSGGAELVAAAIQMYYLAIAKARRELWSDQWSLPI